MSVGLLYCPIELLSCQVTVSQTTKPRADFQSYCSLSGYCPVRLLSVGVVPSGKYPSYYCPDGLVSRNPPDVVLKCLYQSQTYLQPCQTFMLELFAKIFSQKTTSQSRRYVSANFVISIRPLTY